MEVSKLIEENEKLKKEIEELKEIKWKVVEIIADENDNLEEMFIKLIKLFKIPRRNIETTCISKDKIREKIKEVSNGTYDAKIILEKLLEE